jgi:hypothetical protein
MGQANLAGLAREGMEKIKRILLFVFVIGCVILVVLILLQGIADSSLSGPISSQATESTGIPSVITPIPFSGNLIEHTSGSLTMDIISAASPAIMGSLSIHNTQPGLLVKT